MDYLLIVLLGFIILGTAVLNRLRGTGLIKHFGNIKIFKQDVKINLVWNHIFGLWYACLFGFITTWYIGIAIFIAYIIGESKGWGEWVGALTTSEIKDEQWLKRQYIDNEGVGFPYIHQIANAVVKEQIEGTLEEKLKQYNKYATLALTLRGVYWWSLVYGVIAWFGLINLYEYAAIVAILGIGFPIACEIGKMITSNGKIWKIEWSQGWENQELVYGLIQGMCLWYVIIGVVYV